MRVCKQGNETFLELLLCGWPRSFYWL